MAEHNQPQDIPKGQPKKAMTTREGCSMGGERIAYTFGKDVEHPSEFLPDGDLSIAIVGARGSGKSSLLTEIIPQIGNLGQIVLFTLIDHTPIYDGIRDWCEDQGITFAQIADPGAESQEKLHNLISEKPDDKAGLMIFDDFIPGKSGGAANDMALSCFKILRNYGYYCCIITQDYCSLDTKIRANINVNIIFRMGNIYAVNVAAQNIAANGFCSSDEFRKLYNKHVLKGRHSYLMCCNDQKGNYKIYICSEDTGMKLQEVVMRRTDILDNPKIIKLVDRIMVASDNQRMQDMLKDKLRSYCEFLADQSGEEYGDYLSDLNGEFDLSL